jgi:hypothetical protein
MTSQTTRYLLAGLSVGLLSAGILVQLTARATGKITLASDIGLTLSTLGLVTLAITGPRAAVAFYHWAHDRGYVTRDRHARRDAALAAVPPDDGTSRVLRIDRAK